MRVELAEAVSGATVPVVALESTIVAHGMPYPDNLNLQLACAHEVEQQGCAVATVAVVDGVARVGLSYEELARLASEPSTFPKAATRDLPAVLARSSCCATTVSSTAFIAAKARQHMYAFSSHCAASTM